jgi:hypothetical protein
MLAPGAGVEFSNLLNCQNVTSMDTDGYSIGGAASPTSPPRLT